MENCYDTIVAPATPEGRGGVAIIRISGNLVKHICEKLLGKIPKPRFAHYTPFLDFTGNILDAGIALYFPGPASFTGEDVLELHGHGGIWVVQSLVQNIISFGARMAKPGEFSERAFLNNKIDLVQAEAIADLIDAASDKAQRAAMRSLQGEFSNKIKRILTKLISLRMYIEASIDFVEEEIDFLKEEKIALDLALLIEDIQQIQKSASQGVLLREGLTLVIAGEPNVGKSSLLNCLAQTDAAIVTDIPGTTRDVIKQTIMLDGLPLQIVDTAGLRESEDVVEREGIRRAQIEIENADIILHVTDASSPVDFNSQIFPEITNSTHLILVRNKIDLIDESPKIENFNNITQINISAKNNIGIDLLKDHLKKCAGIESHSEGVFSARRRHLNSLKSAENFLKSGQQQLQQFKAGEILAEDLRQTQLALNEITGEFTSNDLLGEIFSNFCIGK